MGERYINRQEELQKEDGRQEGEERDTERHKKGSDEPEGGIS